MSREPSPIFGRAKKRCKPHSRAIARLAHMLIEQGMELAENGRQLQEMEGAFDHEGRLRILAGHLVAEVGQCVLIDARSSVMRRRLRALELEIRKAAKSLGGQQLSDTP